MASSNYRVCCPGVLPEEFNPRNCKAPEDPVSSCSALLQSTEYVVILSVLTALSLLGNLTCFLYWTLTRNHLWRHGYGVILSHLWLSGFVRGVYQMIILVADHLYDGKYHFNDLIWRSSVTCISAGFLSLLSTEASVILLFLLSLDRFLILYVPCSRLHFTTKSAFVTCIAVWFVAACVSAIPLLPGTAHWQFYSSTALCLPLPVVNEDDMAHTFLHGVSCCLNFTVSVFVVIGQILISWSVISRTAMVTDRSQQSRDLIVARRLITVTISCSLCWSLVCILGMLSLKGFDIGGEVKVLFAVLLLPFTAVSNPFLYIFNVMQERRRKVQETRLLVILGRRRSVKN